MKLLSVNILIACFSLFNFPAVFAQNNTNAFIDFLAAKFKYYNLSKQEGVLFAHFDKTIYTNNENVWFTAYLLNNNGRNQNDVLSLALIKDDDHSIALQEKFVMNKGISFGNVFLPDTIPPGDYSFILYTNDALKGKPVNTFIQPVTIKNTAPASFVASLDLLDTAGFPAGGKRKVLLVTDSRGPKIISGALVSYFIGEKLHPVVSGKVKTDKAGQYLFTIPVQNITLGSNVLEAKITFGKETKTVKLALPVYKNRLSVRFYPEGGNLSDGITSTVGWEVKNTVGDPSKVTGILYRDGQLLDTIATNSYGMGRFRLNPRYGSRYYVKLPYTDSKDSVYYLPVIMTDRPVITIKNALADSTLSLAIKGNPAETFYVVVHNYRQLFLSFPVKVNQRGRVIKLMLNDLPKGIAEITVLDSVQRPCAERLFFAHYNERNSLSIHPDKKQYKKREKVTLNLELKNSDAVPINGLVSIACVQENRLELKKQNEIESYVYLKHELGWIPVKENYMGNSKDDKAYIEDLLLIKGWRRYTWNELTKTNALDTINKHDSLVFKGAITEYGKPLKRPLVLVLMKDSGLVTLSTTSTGQFTISNEKLFTTENKKLHLFISGNHIENYNINMEDPYQKINHLIADSYVAPGFYHFMFGDVNNNLENLHGFEHVIHLNEVKINAERDNSIYGLHGENACGDYVCIYNILNCPNHYGSTGNRQPVTGESYIYKGQSGYFYKGCSIDQYDRNKEFNGIYYSMEFYPSDYSQLNPPGPEYISTIYWKHLYKISEKSPPITFYTSDITGNFKIIVQGIGGGDVVAGEKTISVGKP